ncbi:class I SAM-dependent methyltransferase [Streptomyces sp. NPDC059166]|uniref:class I SAM-dependent methyltransferase n=1 Tax=Streptomyces sp. NPDC059166 TaxID=3346752 RepID=UPI00367B0F23
MTEPSYLAAVRTSYDTVAAAYAEHVKDPAELDPLSRGMLAVFAESVRTEGLGPAADLGCGPGKVTAYLADLGVRVLGIDLSPEMIGLARRAHPGLDFVVGSMTAPPVRDDGLGGVLAYYSTHHTPPEVLPVVFEGIRRSLAPGGLLMMAGHLGADEVRRPTQAYGGHPVSFETHLLRPERLATLLEQAGLTVTAQLLEPGTGTARSGGTFLARKSGTR